MSVHVPVPRERGPSPLRAEQVLPLNRRRLEDRMQDLGDLYAATQAGPSWEVDRGRRVFQRRLAADARRPGFALLVAEVCGASDDTPEDRTTSGTAGTAGARGAAVLTGCAYGFPVTDHASWWRGVDRYLPADLARLGASGRLFAVARILVAPEVCTRHRNADWNLARRLQTRLLADHDAAAGVTLVDRTDTATLTALCGWGWRYAEEDTAPGTVLPALPWRLLTLVPR
ncbi:hypothetical protein [Streptomyces griseosporeus]|uniref:hypothetical protein n=1 Tax=Streptomyces griseosporeus TaxID=1910 RepID=UPI0036F8C517